MPANTNPLFIGARKTWAASIADTDGTTPVPVVVAGQEGSLIESIAVTTDDTAAVAVDLFMSDGGTSWQIGSSKLLAGAGTDGGTTPAGDGLNQLDLAWLRDDLSLAIGAGYQLDIAANAALSAGTVLSIVATGGDY